MSLLYLIEDSGRSLLHQMKEAHSRLQGEIQSLHSKAEIIIKSGWAMTKNNSFQQDYEQWKTKTQVMLDDLEKMTSSLEREIERLEAADVADTYPPSDTKNIGLIRDWWHGILRNHGKYSSYAILLVLPSDKETIRYLKEFGKELDLISGKDCLILTFGDSGIKRPNFGDISWVSTVEGHITKGYSINAANIFNVEFSKFPCLLIFNDARSPEHIIVTLKGLTAEGVAEKLRVVFSTIKRAVQEKGNPLKSLELKRKEESFQRAGNSVLSEIKDFAGKTLEMAMEAIIKSGIK